MSYLDQKWILNLSWTFLDCNLDCFLVTFFIRDFTVVFENSPFWRCQKSTTDLGRSFVTVLQTGIGHSGISESMEKIKNKTNVASMAIVSMWKKKPMVNSMSDEKTVEKSQWWNQCLKRKRWKKPNGKFNAKRANSRKKPTLTSMDKESMWNEWSRKLFFQADANALNPRENV